MKQRGNRYCKQCNTKLWRAGFETLKSGQKKQRWECRVCKKTKQIKRTDLTRNRTLQGFASYLTDVLAVRHLSVSRSVFHRRIAWCYDIDPQPPVTGEIYDWIAIDAKHCAGGACAIVLAGEYVPVWEHGYGENATLWFTVLRKIPRPGGVVCDGQKGMLKAIEHLWPGIVIQRCLVHIMRNMRAKLTMHPRTEAGQDLQQLMSAIHRIDDEDGVVAIFIALFDELMDTHSFFLREKTYNSNPLIRRKWWYTHGSVRSAYMQVQRLIEHDQLFAFITHPEIGLPSTTNSIEGGINSPLDELLFRHRGMTPEHQVRVVDWYLDSRSEVSYFMRSSTGNGY